MKHPQQELDKLERFLFEISRNAEPISLSEFDGFCAGVIVCPEMIMPSEWLPVILSQKGPVDIENTTDVEAGVSLIMDHYNRVAKLLTPPCHTFETIYATDPNSGDVLWETWVRGFALAMDIRTKAWDKIMSSGDEDIMTDLTMLLFLWAFDEGELDLSDSEMDEIDQDAPDIIPNIVLNLNDWVKSQHQRGFPLTSQPAANTNIEPFTRGKVGRNDPCLCGSGKKYKKCCG